MNPSRTLVFVTSLALMAATAVSAKAFDAGPYYKDLIHQSAGDRDSRGTPKYYEPATGRVSKHLKPTHWTRTGAGPYDSPSIHQSAGDRDSRGTPKYAERPVFGRSYDSAAPFEPPFIVQRDFQLQGR